MPGVVIANIRSAAVILRISEHATASGAERAVLEVGCCFQQKTCDISKKGQDRTKITIDD